jgi:hypothetical protein
MFEHTSDRSMAGGDKDVLGQPDSRLAKGSATRHYSLSFTIPARASAALAGVVYAIRFDSPACVRAREA